MLADVDPAVEHMSGGDVSKTGPSTESASTRDLNLNLNVSRMRTQQRTDRRCRACTLRYSNSNIAQFCGRLSYAKYGDDSCNIYLFLFQLSAHPSCPPPRLYWAGRLSSNFHIMQLHSFCLIFGPSAQLHTSMHPCHGSSLCKSTGSHVKDTYFQLY